MLGPFDSMPINVASDLLLAVTDIFLSFIYILIMQCLVPYVTATALYKCGTLVGALPQKVSDKDILVIFINI